MDHSDDQNPGAAGAQAETSTEAILDEMQGKDVMACIAGMRQLLGEGHCLEFHADDLPKNLDIEVELPPHVPNTEINRRAAQLAEVFGPHCFFALLTDGKYSFWK